MKNSYFTPVASVRIYLECQGDSVSMLKSTGSDIRIPVIPMTNLLSEFPPPSKYQGIT